MSKSVVVIGAGVVGMAVANDLSARGYSVVVVDRDTAIGTQTSARNSGVIHAGIYYLENSLKARFCLAGRSALYQFCEKWDVAHARVGKLIVATQPNQMDALAALQAKAAANGVDLALISGEQARELEPQLAAHAALVSPMTGIVDAAALVGQLALQSETQGADVVLNTDISEIVPELDRVIIRGQSGGDDFEMAFDWAINAAGHGAFELTRGYWPDAPQPPRQFAKGNYFSISGKSPFERLIYPLPEPGGLGIHFTRDTAGQGMFGPNVEWVDRPDFRVNPGLEPDFRLAIRTYWPGVDNHDLTPAYAGIRPKIAGDDFVIHSQGPIVTLLGIESPGLTSALGLAEHVGDIIHGSA